MGYFLLALLSNLLPGMQEKLSRFKALKEGAKLCQWLRRRCSLQKVPRARDRGLEGRI